MPFHATGILFERFNVVDGLLMLTIGVALSTTTFTLPMMSVSQLMSDTV